MVSSEIDVLYQTSGGVTLDKELVAAASGDSRPIFTKQRFKNTSF